MGRFDTRGHKPNLKVLLLWQEQWHASMIKTLFGSKANMNFERRHRRVVYNRFTAFMHEQKISREEACPKWALLSDEQKQEYDKVAHALNEEGRVKKASLKERMNACNDRGPFGSKNRCDISRGFCVGMNLVKHNL